MMLVNSNYIKIKHDYYYKIIFQFQISESMPLEESQSQSDLSRESDLEDNSQLYGEKDLRSSF